MYKNRNVKYYAAVAAAQGLPQDGTHTHIYIYKVNNILRECEQRFYIYIIFKVYPLINIHTIRLSRPTRVHKTTTTAAAALTFHTPHPRLTGASSPRYLVGGASVINEKRFTVSSI